MHLAGAVYQYMSVTQEGGGGLVFLNHFTIFYHGYINEFIVLISHKESAIVKLLSAI